MSPAFDKVLSFLPCFSGRGHIGQFGRLLPFWEAVPAAGQGQLVVEAALAGFFLSSRRRVQKRSWAQCGRFLTAQYEAGDDIFLNAGEDVMTTGDRASSVSGVPGEIDRDSRIQSGQSEARSRNDEALTHARDFMATVGRETRGDAATATSVADPAVLAKSLGTRFDDETAVTVAAWCALLARCEGTDASYQSWKQVFARLHHPTPPR